MRARTHRHSWPQRPRRVEDRPSASAAVARRRPKSGTYPGQVADARGVPRADVCVERLSRGERLQAEPHAVHAGGKGSHVWARIRVPPNAHARTLTRARMSDVGVCVGHARIGDAFFYEAMRMDIDMCIYHEYKYCICVCSL